MAKLGINTGTAANAGDGSALRAGGNIINANFDEIYEYFGDGTTLDADLAGKWLAVATGINTLSNIGIGTTNPWNALTVLGNASITGVTTSSGGFSGDITGTVTGNVYNTGISTFQDVLVSGASTITGKSTFTGIGTFSSDLYVGGNLYTLGDITYDEVNGRNISVTGVGTVAYLGVTDINVSGFSTFSGLSTTGSDLYIGDSLYVSQDATVTGVITANTARVGVVTSTASTAGDDFIIEGDSDRGMSIISGSESSANIYFGDSSDTDVGRLVYQQTDNSFDFHTNGSATAALRISSTGKIGIDSQSPRSALDVNGSINVGSNGSVGISTTAVTLADNVELKFGDGIDAKIYHNGTNTKFTNGTNQLEIISDDLELRSSTGVQTYIKGAARAGSTAGAYVEIHGDVQFKTGVTTFSQGTTFNNDFVAAGTTANLSWDKSEDYLQFPDHVSAVFGDSADLTIHHDGNDSRITQASGSVGNLMTTNSRSDEQGGIFLQGWTGEDGISVMPHSHVNLYFNDSLKLSTSGLGVTVTGGITCTGAGSTSTFEGDVKMTGNNNFFNPPSLTVTERNNATTMTEGSIIWNETDKRLEYWHGTAWRKIDHSAV